MTSSRAPRGAPATLPAPAVKTMRNWLPTLAAVLAACSSAERLVPPGEWDGTTSQLGDTTVTTTHGGTVAGRHVIDSVAVLWRGDALERPTQLVLVGDRRIAIADRTRIHLIGTDGIPVATLGQRGAGPGEFNQLGAIGATGEAVVGLDRGNRHWARFGDAGALLATGVLAVDPDLPGLEPGRIAIAGDTLVIGWASGVSTQGQPNFGGAVAHPLGGGVPAERGRVTGQPYVFGPSMTGSLAALFGPTPRLAIAPDGRAALSDGVEYCIDVIGGRAPQRICRDWTRVPVTDAVRRPDWDAVFAESGLEPAALGPLREVLELVTVGDHRYALAGLNFDSDGRLWVQAVDSTTADVHPILIRFTPDRRPIHREWDVYDRDGRLHWQLHLPTRFTPWDARGSVIYGLYELDSGELAVATMAVPTRN